MNLKNWQFMHWQRAIVKYFFPFVKPEKGFLIGLALLNMVKTAANALLIWMLGQAISQITRGEFEQLNQTLLIIAGVVLVSQLLQIAYGYNFQRITLRIIDRVRGQLLRHIMMLSFPVLSKFGKGDLIARLTNDVDRVLTFVVNVPLNLFSHIIVLTVYAAMIFWIDWQLALVAFLFAPVFFLSQRYVAPKTGEASRHFVRERAKLIATEEQTLGNLKGISSFNSEDVIHKKHAQQFAVARRWALKVRQIGILYNTFATFLVYIAGVIIIYSGISGIESGRLDIGVLVSFLVYIRNLTVPVRSIARIPMQLQTDRAAAERVMETMSTSGSITESHSHVNIEIQKGGIQFNNVCFVYPQSDKPVFSNLSVVINAGETLALVGPSGSGKSTFANLLLRFFDPNDGVILVDDIDIKKVSLASLREQISIVWQESFIIDASIRENLLLANPHASSEQIIAACKASFCWEFIEKLEHGLDTLIGLNGTTLSIGQVQRLSIAQVFLRDTPILIMDEASSALDSHSERMVVDALQSLRENRTTLIIAHRFSSIRSADRVLYFNGNGTVTLGSHDELMASHRDYKEAVNWQVSQEGTE